MRKNKWGQKHKTDTWSSSGPIPAPTVTLHSPLSTFFFFSFSQNLKLFVWRFGISSNGSIKSNAWLLLRLQRRSGRDASQSIDQSINPSISLFKVQNHHQAWSQYIFQKISRTRKLNQLKIRNKNTKRSNDKTNQTGQKYRVKTGFKSCGGRSFFDIDLEPIPEKRLKARVARHHTR